MLTDRTIDPETERDILALRPGDHLCLLYDEDPAEQIAALLPFIRQGLAEGERVIYVADDSAPDSVRTALDEYGIEAAAAEAAGALVIWTKDRWRPPGPVEPAAKAVQVRRAVHEALDDGHSGVRFAIEMTWTLEPDVDGTELRNWEATLNDELTGEPVRMICQYNKSRLAPHMIETALVTHPLALVDDQMCANAFYQLEGAGAGPSRTSDETASRVEWMLSRLSEARRFEEARRHRNGASSSAEYEDTERARIADLYEIANLTADSLAQVNALKDEFLGLVSHELRTPLTVVLGNADLLLRAEEALDQEEREQALEDIRDEAYRMSRLVTNLLSAARVSLDTSEHMKPVSLAPLLRRVAAQHVRAFPNRRIQVQVQDSDLPCIGIEALIEQTVVNLIGNAEKYSTGDEPIDVGIREDHGWCVVAVKDHGIGLDPTSINRAFEAFYRSEQAADITPGLGIGLTVCKRLVEAQGGQIWARSREGGGAEFCFMLRQAKEEVGAAV